MSVNIMQNEFFFFPPALIFLALYSGKMKSIPAKGKLLHNPGP